MRGSDAGSGALCSYVDLERRVPADHPDTLIYRFRARRSRASGGIVRVQR